MSEKLRDHYEVTWKKVVPTTLGRAYFNVVLGFLLLALMIWAIIVSDDGPNVATIIRYAVTFLILVGFIPRTIAGLLTLRRESADR